MKRWFPTITTIKHILQERPAIKYLPRAVLYITLSLIQLPFHWLELIFFGHKIEKHSLINPPVFVIGHWRSGTTTLQRFLCSHTRVGYLHQYHALLPLGSLLHQYIFRSVMAGIFRLFNMHHPSHKLPMKVDFPSEDDIAFCMGGYHWTPMWAHLFSRKAMYFFRNYLVLKVSGNNRMNFLEEYAFFLKRLSYLNQGKQLVLKSPANTCRISGLTELYPNAKFIYISRDPAEVYFSTMKLLANNEIHWLNNMDDEQKKNLFMYGYEQTMRTYASTKNLVAEDNLLELNLSQLIMDPCGVQQRIYQFLNWRVETNEKISALAILKNNEAVTKPGKLPEEIRNLFLRMASEKVDYQIKTGSECAA